MSWSISKIKLNRRSMYRCMNHDTWNLLNYSKNETEWSLTPHEWTLTPLYTAKSSQSLLICMPLSVFIVPLPLSTLWIVKASSTRPLTFLFPIFEKPLLFSFDIQPEEGPSIRAETSCIQLQVYGWRWERIGKKPFVAQLSIICGRSLHDSELQW